MSWTLKKPLNQETVIADLTNNCDKLEGDIRQLHASAQQLQLKLKTTQQQVGAGLANPMFV